MLPTFVNFFTIIIGGLLGIFLKQRFKKNIQETVMAGVGIMVTIIGISGTLKSDNTILMIICLVLGTIIGELLNIDGLLIRLGNQVDATFSSKNKGIQKGNISEGFVNCTLLFCVGAMAIVGSLQAGIENNYDILLAKSVLDGISSIIFAATLGIGVLLSAGSVLLYQGAITLLAQYIGQFLTDDIVLQMSAVGSLLIIAIGLNMMNITKIRIANMLPAIFLPILYLQVTQYFA